MDNKTQVLATVEDAIELGLLADEFELIKEAMGRTPNFTELSIEWHSRASPILARRNIDRGYTCNTYLLYVVHVCT